MFILQPPGTNCPFSDGSQYRPIGPHTGGIMVGLADGSVRLVNPGVSPTTWWTVLTVNAGDVQGSDW